MSNSSFIGIKKLVKILAMALVEIPMETVAWTWLLNLLMKIASDNVLNIFKNLLPFTLNFGIICVKTAQIFQN